MTFFDRLRALLALVYVYCLGASTMRMLSTNTDPSEVYRIHTSNGGWVRIYCRETIYEITYHAWWIPNAKHYSYEVFGSCDELIPADVAQRICQGVTFGQLLPKFVPRSLQKQTAIHAHVSLIVSQLGQQT